jgi:hypothetical protein
MIMLISQDHAFADGGNSNPKAVKSWVEGFIFGYISGYEIPEKIICKSGEKNKVFQNFQSLRAQRYTDFEVLGVQTYGGIKDSEISVPVLLMDAGRPKQFLRISLISQDTSYCIRTVALNRPAEEIDKIKKMESVFGGESR